MLESVSLVVFLLLLLSLFNASELLLLLRMSFQQTNQILLLLQFISFCIIYIRCNCCSVVVITLIIFTANRVNINGSGNLFEEEHTINS